MSFTLRVKHKLYFCFVLHVFLLWLGTVLRWGWGETSGCPMLWGCSMVCIGKIIANCSKKRPISFGRVRHVPGARTVFTNPLLSPSPPPSEDHLTDRVPCRYMNPHGDARMCVRKKKPNRENPPPPPAS